jgi:hypothetical protein
MPYKSYAEFARTKGAKDKAPRRRGTTNTRPPLDFQDAPPPPRPMQVASREPAGALVRQGNQGLVRQGNQGLVRQGNQGGGALTRVPPYLSDTREGAKGGALVKQGRARRTKAKIGDVKNAPFIAGGKRSLMDNLLGTTTKGRILRGGGLLAAAGGAAATLNYLKNRKKPVDNSLRGRSSRLLASVKGKVAGAVNRSGVVGKGRKVEVR